jgi:hypothetical protein
MRLRFVADTAPALERSLQFVELERAALVEAIAKRDADISDAVERILELDRQAWALRLAETFAT